MGRGGGRGGGGERGGSKMGEKGEKASFVTPRCVCPEASSTGGKTKSSDHFLSSVPPGATIYPVAGIHPLNYMGDLDLLTPITPQPPCPAGGLRQDPSTWMTRPGRTLPASRRPGLRRTAATGRRRSRHPPGRHRRRACRVDVFPLLLPSPLLAFSGHASTTTLGREPNRA